MKFGSRELIFVLLLMALPISAYFWVFKPVNEHIHRQQEAIDVNTQKLANCRKALTLVQDLNAELRRQEEAVSFFESKLPSRHEIDKVLNQVTRIARNHNLETKLFKTSPPKPFARYSELPIRMDIYGDFDAYYEFLLDLEKMPRLTKIKEMHLEDKTKTNNGMMDAEFTLSIFFDNESVKQG